MLHPEDWVGRFISRVRRVLAREDAAIGAARDEALVVLAVGSPGDERRSRPLVGWPEHVDVDDDPVPELDGDVPLDEHRADDLAAVRGGWRAPCAGRSGTGVEGQREEAVGERAVLPLHAHWNGPPAPSVVWLMDFSPRVPRRLVGPPEPGFWRGMPPPERATRCRDDHLAAPHPHLLCGPVAAAEGHVEPSDRAMSRSP